MHSDLVHRAPSEVLHSGVAQSAELMTEDNSFCEYTLQVLLCLNEGFSLRDMSSKTFRDDQGCCLLEGKFEWTRIWTDVRHSTGIDETHDTLR